MRYALVPCRSDYPEIRTMVDPTLAAKLDKLAHENDMLREALLAVPQEHVDTKVRRLISKNQVEHRKEDLARLKETFRQRNDFGRFEKVILADPKKPLEPQLGFDPDAF
jgi:hypothetical protein